MSVDLVLKNAKTYISGEVIEAGLAIKGDRIVRIAKDTNLPSASEVMNLKGLLTLPGLIDAHVHLRDQELAHKEDFYTGTAAAANGGVTLVIDMPNNRPVTMDRRTLGERMRLATEKTVVNLAFYSAFPEKIEEIQAIVREGAKAFKLYMSQKVGGLDPDDDEALAEALRETSKLKVPVCVHAEERHLLEDALRLMKKKGVEGAEAYLKVHSPKAEVEAIDRITNVAKKSLASIHVCHVSTSRGLETIISSRQEGSPITCEVTPQHLLLTRRDLKNIGAVALTNPPPRSEKEVRSLWSALRGGAIDILVSDHAPHALDEKKRDAIWDVAPGISGVETLLPLMLDQVSRGRLSISKLVRLTSERPAEIFGISDRGGLKEGNYADLVVVDLNEEWRIDSSQFRSKAKFSPFDGWRVRGKPVKTFVNGRLVMDDGEILGRPGDGRVIR